MLKRYLLIENTITGKIVYHGIFVNVAQAMRVINKNKERRDSFFMQEVWIEKDVTE
ncbi:hypothetical protein ACEN4K_03745 [Marinilactibacillus psychrotolerans]|uniref:hypothetical protein n=1 Tax=Marinilactibacillus psychrotolerans TaxID=191770 RepID=UPI00388B1167